MHEHAGIDLNSVASLYCKFQGIFKELDLVRAPALERFSKLAPS